MRKASLQSTALVALLGFAGFAAVSFGAAPASSQTLAERPGDAPGLRAPGLAKEDRDFVNEVAMGGLLEVQLGQLAQRQAGSEEVKKFGQRMADDHTKVNDKLAQLALQKGIDVPKELDKKHLATFDKLSKLGGSKFDKEYMSDMVADHEDDVKAFEKQVKDGHDTELKDFAATTLPTLREHLTLARDTEAKVKAEK